LLNVSVSRTIVEWAVLELLGAAGLELLLRTSLRGQKMRLELRVVLVSTPIRREGVRVAASDISTRPHVEVFSPESFHRSRNTISAHVAAGPMNAVHG